MNRLTIIGVFAASLAATSGAWATGLPAAWAGESNYAEAGRIRAQFCTRCHGVSGISKYSGVPNLAGQNTEYLVKQLKDFRSGFRRSAPMREVALSLSNEEITGLANYFNSLK